MKKIILNIVIFAIFQFVNGQQSTSLVIKDTRNVNDLPNYSILAGTQIQADFKQNSVIGISNSNAGFYSTNLTLGQWGDNSGGKSHQLNLNNNGMYYRNALPQDSGWGSWNKLLMAPDSGTLHFFTGGLNSKISGYGDPQNYYIGHFDVLGSAGLDLHWYGGIRFGDSTSSSVMQITGGNVGIGTTTPTEKLQVEGGNIGVKLASNEGPAISLHNPTKNGVGSIWRMYNMTGQYGNSLQFWNYPDDFSTQNQRLILSDNGNMALLGKFESKEIKVSTTPTADFVFANEYKLPTLASVEKHIKENKHLHEIASAKEMEKNGVNVGEFQIKLLQKIEELTLYAIAQNKKIEEQNKRILALEKTK